MRRFSFSSGSAASSPFAVRDLTSRAGGDTFLGRGYCRGEIDAWNERVLLEYRRRKRTEFPIYRRCERRVKITP